MQIVYTADNDAEAHMMAHMLEREDIPAHIQGTFLSGGLGELPASNLVQIMVADDHVEHAREIIEQWETSTAKEEKKPFQTKRNLKTEFIAFVLGCLLMFIVLEYIT